MKYLYLFFSLFIINACVQDSPNIKQKSETEKRVAYTNILVRNAFKSYRDILKEISFSPLMGENLSYINSKSVAYNWETQSTLIYPAENYAREIMQLYSLGLCMLNPDGSEIIADDGNCVPVYTNNEIFEYSRVWTGFKAQPLRGNVETVWEEGNHNDVDPLKIERRLHYQYNRVSSPRRAGDVRPGP